MTHEKKADAAAASVASAFFLADIMASASDIDPEACRLAMANAIEQMEAGNYVSARQYARKAQGIRTLLPDSLSVAGRAQSLPSPEQIQKFIVQLDAAEAESGSTRSRARSFTQARAV